MSASLVGSEMCIRDSRRPGWRGRTKQDPSARSELVGQAALNRFKRHKPVSYTHLTLPTICSV
eukprot:7291319-Alexandrium_andersonii.AAC.1